MVCLSYLLVFGSHVRFILIAGQDAILEFEVEHLKFPLPATNKPGPLLRQQIAL